MRMDLNVRLSVERNRTVAGLPLAFFHIRNLGTPRESLLLRRHLTVGRVQPGVKSAKDDRIEVGWNELEFNALERM